MASPSFRFVHASDLHLERPAAGLAELPEHLRELFLEAPYLAAERVFETVLAERADFLILAGDVLDARAAGPRGIDFLRTQFARLTARGIYIFWASGRAESLCGWPDSIALGEGVQRFSRHRAEGHVWSRDGLPLAYVTGRASAGGKSIRGVEFRTRASELFTIAVAHDMADAESLRDEEIDYWALGGRHHRHTLCDDECLAHYPGTTQGRHPREPGPHGCTLVEVEGADAGVDRQVHTRLIPTDVLRWVDERVAVEETATLDDLHRDIERRIEARIVEAPDTDLIISWTLTCSQRFAAWLHRRGGQELLGPSQQRFGYGPPARWSVLAGVEPSSLAQRAAAEHETLLGDFLREIAAYQSDPDLELNLEPYVSERHLAGVLGTIARIGRSPARDRILNEAALLGIDLLGADVLGDMLGKEAQP